ncbi:MAG: glucosidase, partial [Acidobacteria bacterium]|nr:glucosidase [Acidobacteriota bacterium]
MSAEHGRLENPKQWRAWGPYVASRQWGTVREDYSANGDAWNYFPFDHAHQRAYRWGEDGLAGISDADGLLNFSIALHNGKDDRLKERLFGLTNGQGNHGEDVKEYWWPLDATPTHSWASWLYRYPQAAYPYQQLVAENGARSKQEPEFELSDTGVLDHNRFFDISVDHAKADVDDLLITITATNHGPDMAPLELLGQLWFTNTWAWGNDPEIPELRALVIAGEDPTDSALRIAASHHRLGNFVLAAEPHLDAMPTLLFCDNETNDVELYGAETNRTAYPKDGINNAVVHGDFAGVNPQNRGTKAAVRYSFAGIAPGQSVTVRLRLRADSANAVIDGTTRPGMDADFGPTFAATMAQRSHEADSFYAAVIPASASVEDAHVARRAFAGLMWGKQLYRYTVEDWLEGDPAQPPPPPERKQATGAVPGRNTRWRNLDLAHVISMPDEWEYPWFAAWDLAFHTVPLAHIDPAFAKDQLLLLCREFVLHPDGQLPAYEWAFGDVNPPVHAWAAWQIYTL